MNKAIQNLPYSILMILILIIGSVYLFSDSMHLYPTYIHSWTQSDRLAIAMRFQENGYDFFHPATYNLLTKDGITQVDFPIHDYLVAVISGTFKLDIISCFRYYELIYSLIGLFFLFKAVQLLSNSSLKAILLTSLITSLPFFAYYQNGFLPSVPSYANLCIGLFFYIKYLKTKTSRSYTYMIIFIGLAALARIPFSIFLFAIFLERSINCIKERELRLFELLLPILGMSVTILYYFYNQSLAEEYGSMFLSEFMYPRSFEEFYRIFLSAADRWSGQFLSPFHYLMILILMIGIIWNRKEIQLSSELKQLFTFGVIGLLGSLSYFFLMGRQFIDHDYYYIDSLLAAITVLLIVVIAVLKVPKTYYSSLATLCLIILIGSYSHASSVLKERYSTETNAFQLYSYNAFKELKNDIEKWGINREDTLAFFDIGSTNVPFTILKNKGYTSLSSGAKSCQILLNKDFDYAFILDSTKVSDSYFDHPEIAEQLEWLGSNGKISYYRKSSSKDHGQFFEDLRYRYSNDFENELYDSLTDLNASIESGLDTLNSALVIDTINEYILTTSYRIKNEQKGKDLRLAVNFDIQALDSAKGLQYIISLPPYYFAYYIQSEVLANQDWENISLYGTIPKRFIEEGKELKVYFWNQEKRTNFLDNYHLIIYQ